MTTKRAGILVFSMVFGLSSLIGCGKQEPAPAPAEPVAAPVQEAPAPPVAAPALDASKLRESAKALFGALPATMESAKNPLTEPKIVLGRQLYFDERLSKNHDLSCNSCHQLDAFGADVRTPGAKTSSGHKGQLGGRNSPTVYNAALHFAQFWDGRAADVEEQAKGPILNPVEMAMPSEAAVVAVVKSIPGYEPMFAAAFPETKDPITYDNLAKAIGAFERKLVTPGPFDKFLAGDDAALGDEAKKGLSLFTQVGCTACHSGPALGGQMYQKLGLLKPYPTADQGRFDVTKNEADKFMFKVPSLRNIDKTAPYFHDGSIATLPEAVKIMAEHQTAKGTLSDEETSQLVAFLQSLTGELPADYIKEPAALEAGKKTPKPDPN